MKTSYLRLAFVFFCLASVGYAQSANFSGCVFNDEDKPEKGLRVFVDDKKATTDGDGNFSIDHLVTTAGSPINLNMDKQGWAILTPFMGKTMSPNSQGKSGCERITIAPRHSSQFLDSEHLASLIAAMRNAAMSVEAKNEIRSETEATRDQKKQLVLDDYAKWSGFDVSEIQAALRERVKDKRALGTSREADFAYLNKEYSKSGFLYRKAATDDPAWEKNEMVSPESQKVIVKRLLNSGTAYFEGYEFKEASDSFEMLEKKYFANGKYSENLQSEWLDLKYLLGRTKVQLSSEAKLDQATTLLNDAIDNYKQALKSVTGNQFLDSQAKLQYGLGTAFLALGKNRFNSKDDISSINRAIETFNQAAITVDELNRRSNSTIDLVGLQMSLGEAWDALGEKTSGRESIGYFTKALGAFDQAGKAIKPEDKLARANLNINRGRTFGNLADQSSEPTRRVVHLKDAVGAFQEAGTTYLELLDSGQNSCISCAAASLINSGIVWSQLGQTVNDSSKSADYRDKTLAAFEKADKVINRINRDVEPVTLARLKAVLGKAFSDLAVRTGDARRNAQYLDRAVTAHDEAYALVNQGYCHSCAVQSLIELGTARSMLGQTIRDAAKSAGYFDKALDAFDKADTAINKTKQEGRPLTWAESKSLLGNAFSNLAYRISDPAKSAPYLERAAMAYSEAYDLANQDHCSACAVHLLIDLGSNWDRLSQVTRTPAKIVEYREKSLAAFDKADKAINNIKRENEPLNWANSKARLGSAFSDLAGRTGDPAKNAEFLNKAVSAFDAAAAVYNSPDVTQDYCSYCAVHSLIDLGNAWNTLGQAVRKPLKSAEYSKKASDAFEKADKVINSIKGKEDKVVWANLKSELGQNYFDSANGSGDPVRRVDYLNRAAAIYDEVAKVYEGADESQEYCSPCAASTLIALGVALETLGQTDRDRRAGYRERTLSYFSNADKIITRIKRDEEPLTWANLKAQLGDGFSYLAARAMDPKKNAEFVEKAAAAYEEETRLYATLLTNEEYCSPCATLGLVNLGIGWNTLGERTSDALKGVPYLSKALDAYDKANKTLRHEEDEGTVANLNLNLGQTFFNLANTANDQLSRENYLDKAAAAYERVTKAYTVVFASQDHCSPCEVRSLIGLGNDWNTLAQATNEPAKSEEYRKKTLDAFDKADKALTSIKNETEPASWANLKAEFGDAFSDLAGRTNDPVKKAQFVEKAAAAYEEKAKVYATLFANEDYCSPCVTAGLITLGTAWTELGERVSAVLKSEGYFSKALDAFDKADKTLKRDDDKLVWANLNMNLGRTYSDLAGTASDSTKAAHYLNKAATSFEEARKVYTVQHDEEEWAGVRINLANTYLLLGNWTAAIESSNEVLQSFPDDSRAFSAKLAALHDGLFHFDEALEVNKAWLARDQDDSGAQFNLAENYFTTANFEQSSSLIDKLLNETDDVQVKSALRVIQIGCLLATDHANEVSAKLEGLIKEVEMQPAAFRVTWTFHGTRNFVEQSRDLANREWFKKLLDAIENKPQDIMLKDLKVLQAKFKN